MYFKDEQAFQAWFTHYRATTLYMASLAPGETGGDPRPRTDQRLTCGWWAGGLGPQSVGVPTGSAVGGGSVGAGTRGRAKVRVVPPGSLVAQMRPPWASTMRLQM